MTTVKDIRNSTRMKDVNKRIAFLEAQLVPYNAIVKAVDGRIDRFGAYR